MSDTLQATIFTASEDTRALLIAMLSAHGFEAFEESEDALIACGPVDAADEAALAQILESQSISFKTEVLAPQNWNAKWEAGFEPVVVEGFCTIRAHFHEIEVTTPHDIIITPKMSFGTGHHATTQLMVELMRDMAFSGMSVLDFGTGTGILAILSEQQGAEQVKAIDNDVWAIENAIENGERNGCKRILFAEGSLEVVEQERFDVILANINLHILLQYMDAMSEKLPQNGQLLLSGILTSDEPAIMAAASSAGLTFVKAKDQSGWYCMLFRKAEN